MCILVNDVFGSLQNVKLQSNLHLLQISDYKNPGCDHSGMQQGMYTLKQHIWDSEFDPVHALLRAYNRRHFQSAMDRYSVQ